MSHEVLSTARILIPLAAVGAFVDTARYNLIQVLRPIHDPINPTLISISCLWVGVLAAYLMGFKTDLGVYGVVAGYSIGIVLGCFLVGIRWLPRISSKSLAERSDQLDEASFFRQCYFCLFKKQSRDLEDAASESSGAALSAEIVF